MGTILEEITGRKRKDLTCIKEVCTPHDLYKRVEEIMETGHYTQHSLTSALNKSATGIISEFKRKSPSLGWIKEEAQPEDIIPGYTENGASALSVLTDEPYFGGKPEFVTRARALADIPILRKDFIIDEYQVFESRNIGADVILLIAACLSKEECQLLARRAKELDLEVLLEVHEERELEYICDGVSAVGVNNRNLHTFKTDITTSFQLERLIPNEFVKISESGLHHAEDIRLLRTAGFRGFLMGERFMKSYNPAKALGELIQAL